VNVIEVELVLKDQQEAMFEERFCNEDTKFQTWSKVESIGHYH